MPNFTEVTEECGRALKTPTRGKFRQSEAQWTSVIEARTTVALRMKMSSTQDSQRLDASDGRC
jgi:hypothetical protein